MLYKPSERTPGTGWLLAKALDSALPAGVLSLLTGGAEVGAALAGQEVDVVAHVGSTATGRAIAAAGARTGAKVRRCADETPCRRSAPRCALVG